MGLSAARGGEWGWSWRSVAGSSCLPQHPAAALISWMGGGGWGREASHPERMGADSSSAACAQLPPQVRVGGDGEQASGVVGISWPEPRRPSEGTHRQSWSFK